MPRPIPGPAPVRSAPVRSCLLFPLLVLAACGGAKSIALGTEDTCVESSWYVDNDGDGYGDEAGLVYACEQPPGYSAQPGDCADDAAAVSPEVEEACNGIDDDCDGLADDEDPMAYGSRRWFHDGDGDGYGLESVVAWACLAPDGYAADAGDCDDSSAEVSPDAAEVCDDGVDQDCDGHDEAC